MPDSAQAADQTAGIRSLKQLDTKAVLQDNLNSLFSLLGFLSDYNFADPSQPIPGRLITNASADQLKAAFIEGEGEQARISRAYQSGRPDLYFLPGDVITILESGLSIYQQANAQALQKSPQGQELQSILSETLDFIRQSYTSGWQNNLISKDQEIALSRDLFVNQKIKGLIATAGGILQQGQALVSAGEGSSGQELAEEPEKSPLEFAGGLMLAQAGADEIGEDGTAASTAEGQAAGTIQAGQAGAVETAPDISTQDLRLLATSFTHSTLGAVLAAYASDELGGSLVRMNDLSEPLRQGLINQISPQVENIIVNLNPSEVKALINNTAEASAVRAKILRQTHSYILNTGSPRLLLQQAFNERFEQLQQADEKEQWEKLRTSLEKNSHAQAARQLEEIAAAEGYELIQDPGESQLAAAEKGTYILSASDQLSILQKVEDLSENYQQSLPQKLNEVVEIDLEHPSINPENINRSLASLIIADPTLSPDFIDKLNHDQFTILFGELVSAEEFEQNQDSIKDIFKQYWIFYRAELNQTSPQLKKLSKYTHQKDVPSKEKVGEKIETAAKVRSQLLAQSKKSTEEIVADLGSEEEREGVKKKIAKNRTKQLKLDLWKGLGIEEKRQYLEAIGVQANDYADYAEMSNEELTKILEDQKIGFDPMIFELLRKRPDLDPSDIVQIAQARQKQLQAEVNQAELQAVLGTDAPNYFNRLEQDLWSQLEDLEKRNYLQAMGLGSYAEESEPELTQALNASGLVFDSLTYQLITTRPDLAQKNLEFLRKRVGVKSNPNTGWAEEIGPLALYQKRLLWAERSLGERQLYLQAIGVAYQEYADKKQKELDSFLMERQMEFNWFAYQLAIMEQARAEGLMQAFMIIRRQQNLAEALKMQAVLVSSYFLSPRESMLLRSGKSIPYIPPSTQQAMQQSGVIKSLAKKGLNFASKKLGRAILGSATGGASEAVLKTLPAPARKFVEEKMGKATKPLVIAGLGGATLAGILAAMLKKGVAAGLGASLGAGGGIYLGAKAGAALGSVLGPIGTIVGGVVGGIVGGVAGALAGGNAGIAIHNAWNQLGGSLNSIGIKEGLSSAGNALSGLWNTARSKAGLAASETSLLSSAGRGLVAAKEVALEFFGNIAGQAVFSYTAFTAVGTMIVTMNAASTFLADIPLEPGYLADPEESRFVAVRKTAEMTNQAGDCRQSNVCKDPSFPVEVKYTISIEPKENFVITVVEIEDVVSVTHNEEKYQELGISVPSIPTLTRGAEELGVELPITLSSGGEGSENSPLIISYTVTYDENHNHSSIRNRATLNFHYQEPGGQLGDETVTAVSLIRLGDSPEAILCWPASGVIVQGPYHDYSHSVVDAYDIIPRPSVTSDLAIYAPVDGRLCPGRSGHGSLYDLVYGEHISLSSEINGEVYVFVFGHLEDGTALVKNSCTDVFQGQQIGTMGNTGRSDGIHLHFERRTGYFNTLTLTELMTGTTDLVPNHTVVESCAITLE